jgi:hypothetical protein
MKLVDRTLVKYYNEEKKDMDPEHIITDVDYEVHESDDNNNDDNEQ